jgi:hypothetical protein
MSYITDSLKFYIKSSGPMLISACQSNIWIHEGILLDKILFSAFSVLSQASFNLILTVPLRITPSLTAPQVFALVDITRDPQHSIFSATRRQIPGRGGPWKLGLKKRMMLKIGCAFFHLLLTWQMYWGYVLQRAQLWNNEASITWVPGWKKAIHQFVSSEKNFHFKPIRSLELFQDSSVLSKI